MGRFWPEGERRLSWLLGALAEGAAATPWLLAVYAFSHHDRWPEAVPGAWLLLALYLAGASWERVHPVGVGRTGRWWRLAGMALGVGFSYWLALVSLPLGLRPPSVAAPNLAWWVMPLAAYLWYQGAQMGSGVATAGYLQLSRHFLWQVGGQAFSLVLLYAEGAGHEAGLPAFLAGCVLLLYATGLGLLARVRRHALRSGTDGEGGPDGRNGLVSLLLVVVTAGAAMATSALSAERLARLMTLLGRVLDPLLRAVGLVLGYVAYPFAWLLEHVLVPLFRRIGAGRMLEELMAEPPARPNGLELSNGEPAITPELLSRYGASLLLLAALITAAWFLLRLRRRAGTDLDDDAEEVRVSLGFWSNLWSDLRGLLRGGKVPDPGGGTVSGAEEDGVTPGSPRWLYRRLQALGRQSGRARGPGETPAVYAAALAGHLPHAAEAARAVTAVYSQARYGPEPPAEAAVAAAAAELDSVGS